MSIYIKKMVYSGCKSPNSFFLYDQASLIIVFALLLILFNGWIGIIFSIHLHTHKYSGIGRYVCLGTERERFIFIPKKNWGL